MPRTMEGGREGERWGEGEGDKKTDDGGKGKLKKRENY